MKKRVFLLDPICFNEFGHNIHLLKYYHKYFKEKDIDTKIVTSKHLQGNHDAIEKHFSHYYEDKIPIWKDEDKKEFYIKTKRINHSGKKIVESLASYELVELFEKYKIGCNDVIIYPGVDLYSLLAIINKLNEMSPSDSPEIKLKFLGVLEFGGGINEAVIEYICENINKLIDRGFKFKFAVETPIYSDYLSKYIKKEVLVVPYPETSEYKDVEKKNIFNIICPGSSRIDKGFLHLQRIVKEINRIDETFNFMITTQSLNHMESRQYADYTSKLYSSPNISLLDYYINESKMKELYITSNLVLLPYDKTTYYLRGSAVLNEAIGYGRPVLSLNGTGFESTIKFFNLGWCVDHIDELPQMIINISRQNNTFLNNKIISARRNYISYVTAANKSWINI